MTVAEVIALLQQQPQDAIALLPGYEGDFTEALRIEQRPVVKRNAPWYYGEWSEVDGGEAGTIGVAILPDIKRMSAGS